jgi:hypothetical protein
VTLQDVLSTSGSVTSQIPLRMKCDVSNTTWSRSWRLITGMKQGALPLKVQAKRGRPRCPQAYKWLAASGLATPAAALPRKTSENVVDQA